MIYRQVLLLPLCIFSINVSHSELYKWTDAAGHTHYGDKPPENAAIPVAAQINDKKSKNISRDNSQVDNPSQTLSEGHVLRIRGLLKQSKYQMVTAILKQLQALTDTDIVKEPVLFQAYTAFDLDDIAYEPTFNRWITTHPKSSYAYLARARFYYSLGWRSRGSKFRDKTTDNQLDNMKFYFTKSTLDINKAISLDNHSLLPYSLRIGIGKSQSDRSVIKLALDQALKISPASYYVRKYYIDTLEPRWGGSSSAMDRFAKSSQKMSSKNPNLKLLLGFSLADTAHSQYRVDNYDAAEKLFTKALSFGATPEIYYAQGKNSYFQQDYTQAIHKFTLAISLFNTSSDFYYWRAKSYRKLLEYENTYNDIKTALLLNPTDDRIIKFQNTFTEKIKSLKRKDQGKSKAARDITELKLRLNKDPDNSNLHYQTAMAQIKLNKLEFAYRHLQQAIKLDPHVFEYYRVIDYVLLKQGDLHKILTYWEKYLIINPTDSRAYAERGGTYTQLKELELALKDYKKAAELGNKEAQKIYTELLTLEAAEKKPK